MQIKNWSLTKQLSLGVFLLITLIMSMLIAMVGYQSRAVLINQAEISQDSQVALLASQLDTAYDTIMDSTERLASTFKELYPAPLELSSQETIKIGQYNSIKVTHNSEQINLNFEQVDRFSRMTGGNATVFIRHNDDFLRVTTSLKNQQGQRAIGTLLGKKHPGYRQLMKGDTYTGEARLFGTDYMTKYSPVVINNTVVAVFYVGYPISNLLKKLREHLVKTRFGDTGHAGIVYNSQSQLSGKLVADQYFEGQALVSSYKNTLFSDVLNSSSGAFEYTDNTHPNGVRVSYHRAGNSPWTTYAISFKEEYSRQVKPLLWLLISLAVVAVFILVLLLSVFLRNALKPLKEVEHILKSFGRGDLTAKFSREVNLESLNELDQLQISVLTMVEEVSKVIVTVRNSGDQVTSTSDIIYLGSDELKSAADASSSEIIQVSTAITQVADSIHHVAENVSSVAEEAQSTSQLAESGKQAVIGVEQTIELLNKEFSQVVTIISSLEKDSAEIGKVVDVINAVAEQTNLLALNAAIEAARAGEQGRGFAVVADEVRTLAKRVQESTKEIQQVVSKLQDNALKASEQIKASEVQMSESVGRVSLAQELLEQIQSATHRVRERMLSVASATEEQSCASEQISQSSINLQERSKQVAAQALSSAQASQLMLNSAKSLQSQVSLFKVVEHSD